MSLNALALKAVQLCVNLKCVVIVIVIVIAVEEFAGVQTGGSLSIAEVEM